MQTTHKVTKRTFITITLTEKEVHDIIKAHLNLTDKDNVSIEAQVYGGGSLREDNAFEVNIVVTE